MRGREKCSFFRPLGLSKTWRGAGGFLVQLYVFTDLFLTATPLLQCRENTKFTIFVQRDCTMLHYLEER